MNPIFWKSYTVIDSYSGRPVLFEGWSHKGAGIFDSYLSALASNSDCWEEYCDFYRRKL